MPIPIAGVNGSTTGHLATQTIDGVKYVYKPGKGWVEAENSEFYIGYNSNSGVNAEVNGIGISQNGFSYNPTYMSKSGTQNKPGYSRNAAATAKDIAQGGMTKEELEQWNIEHPNETALRGK